MKEALEENVRKYYYQCVKTLCQKPVDRWRNYTKLVRTGSIVMEAILTGLILKKYGAKSQACARKILKDPTDYRI